MRKSKRPRFQHLENTMEIKAQQIIDALHEATSTAYWLGKNLAEPTRDPFEFGWLVKDWAEEEGIDLGEDEDNYAPDQLSGDQLQSFQDWLDHQNLQNHPCLPTMDQPANWTMTTTRSNIKPGTWLVHFTDNAWKVAKKGFAYGSDYEGLHLTTWRRNRQVNRGPFAFAFEAGNKFSLAAARGKKYGSDAVLFQCSGAIEAYHTGDEENQVVFDKDHTYCRVPIYRCHNGEWRVEDCKAERNLFQGDFLTVVQWVGANFRQYQTRISPTGK